MFAWHPTPFRQYHAIGFEGVLQDDTPEFVHHLVLTGFLFGNESGGLNSLRVQVYYDNPDGVSGKNDSSGVRVDYTEELRPMNMGLVKLGDPQGALHPQPLPDGKSVYSFGCPGTCTETYFEVGAKYGIFVVLLASGRSLLPTRLTDSSTAVIRKHLMRVCLRVLDSTAPLPNPSRFPPLSAFADQLLQSQCVGVEITDLSKLSFRLLPSFSRAWSCHNEYTLLRKRRL